MKYILPIILVAFTSIATIAHSASGSTSTGSTSTGSTSTGIITPAPIKGNGGPIRAFNYTTNQMDMWPQCFPWVFVTDYRNGNLISMYLNQNVCREKRAIDFVR